MNNLIKTNVPGYYKDSDTNAVINTSNEYDTMKAQRKKSQEFESMKQKINKVENDINDIKSMLLQIIDGKKNG